MALTAGHPDWVTESLSVDLRSASAEFKVAALRTDRGAIASRPIAPLLPLMVAPRRYAFFG